MAYALPDYRQAAPYAVQVEPTEGCNLRCVFCGLNGIRGKNVRETDKYMTVETATALAESMRKHKWNSRIEFAMHGEPTLNPNLVDIVHVIRMNLPRASIMLTTNGVPLHKQGLEGQIRALFSAGLNFIALDNYAGLTVARDMRVVCAENDIPCFEYPSNPEGNPHRRHDPRYAGVAIVQDIGAATSGTHATLNNHAGAGAPLNNKAAGKRCAKPFREMSIRWDGSVAICCNSWRGDYVIGNINERSVHSVWHDPRFYAARKYLLQGRREFKPCLGCDALSYRPGLLPDPKGLYSQSYPKPDDADDAVIAEALADGPLTPPVLRPWEKPLNVIQPGLFDQEEQDA